MTIRKSRSSIDNEILAEIQILSSLLENYSQISNKQHESTTNKLMSMDDTLNKLSVKVGIQNGRVDRLENLLQLDSDSIKSIEKVHLNCPGLVAVASIENFNKTYKHNPVVWIINNWRPVMIISIFSLVVYHLFPKIASDLFQWVSGINAEIGF